MKKILSVGSAFFFVLVGLGVFISTSARAEAATIYVDASATSTGNGTQTSPFQTINEGINAASSSDTIDVASGTYLLSAELDITKPLSIVGSGTVMVQANSNFGSNNSTKHLLGIYAGTQADPITISNVTLDCKNNCYGLNTYNNAYGVLNNVAVINSLGAGLTVNGSTIVANNLSTSGNAWGAVNVDPGSGVTTPSVFTLTSGNLAENNQIWSDGSNATGTATVLVTAPSGYGAYKVGNTAAGLFWTNKVLTNVATITKGGVTTVYSTIQAAVDAASSGDTIDVASGTYPETVSIAKPLTINGIQAGVAGASASGTQRSGDESIVNAMNITASNVVVNGFSFTNPGIQMNITGSSGNILSGVQLEDNIFNGYASVGIPTDDAGNLLISGNYFTTDATGEPMQIKSDSTTGGCNGTTIKNNVFHSAGNNNGADINFSCTESHSTGVTVTGNTDLGNTGGESFAAFAGIADDLTITSNTATGINGSALYFWGGMTGSTTIANNKIMNGSSSAVSIHDDLDGVNTGTFTITNNIFSGNGHGIYAAGGAVSSGANIVAHGNDFSGNSAAGIENASVTTSTSLAVNATGNWWGASTGPADLVSGDGSIPDTNASGTGSAAIGAVAYGNWCTNSYCDMTRPTLVYNFPAVNTIASSSLSVSVTASDAGSGIANVVVHYYNASGTFPGACGSGAMNLGGVPTYTYVCTLNVSALPDGNYSLRSGTFDVAGNNQTVSLPFVVNHATPSVSTPTLTWPVNGDITPTNTFTFKWNSSTASIPGPITYEFHSSMNPAEIGGVLTTGLWDSGALTTSSILSNGAPNGTWYWQVRAKDADGNTSAWSAIWAVTLNTVPPPALATCPAGTSPTFVETDMVNSNSYVSTTGSSTLTNGQTYLLVASGAWKNGGINVADPAYASVDNWTTYMQGYNIAPSLLGSGEFQLQVGGSFVNWGAYQPTHKYSYLYTGTGKPISLMVFDGDSAVASATPNDSWYGDNSGDLSVNIYACNSNTPVPVVYITTDAATNVGRSNATLNGTNVADTATGHSFWVSTSTFSTASPNIPSGVYSTPDFGAITASTTFSASLSSITTDGIPRNLSVITPSTTYYYAAWSFVNGTWHPGAIMSFTTAPASYVTTDAATGVATSSAMVNGTNGSSVADNTSFWWGTTPITGTLAPGVNPGGSSEFPSTGWAHDNGLGSALAGGSFNESLTNLTPSTTYYFVAWSQIGGVWYPGAVMTLTTPALGSDDTLSALGVSVGELSPSFSSGVTSYTDLLPYSTTLAPTVTATTTDPNATYIVTPAGSTTGATTVKVTAQNGSTTQDYTVNFSVASATTSMLTVKVLVDNSASGTATSSDFKVELFASGASTSSFPGSVAGTEVTINPNTSYHVNIQTLRSYTPALDASGSCNSESGLPAGSTAVCTITETYNAPDTYNLAPLFSVIVGGGPGGGNENNNGDGGGKVLGASITGTEFLQQQIAQLQQQLLALLQQYLATLHSRGTH